MQPLSSRGGALVAAIATGAIVTLVTLSLALGLDWALIGLWHLPVIVGEAAGLALGGLSLFAGAWVGLRAYRQERSPGEV